MAEELLELQILTEKKYVFIFSHIGPAILLDWIGERKVRNG
jgi:hypothetical protein